MGDIGSRIKALRLYHGLTLQALADKVGCSKSGIWDVENKKSGRPSAIMVSKLADALDTTMEHLVNGTPCSSVPPQDVAFFRRYQRLSQRAKHHVRVVAQMLEE